MVVSTIQFIKALFLENIELKVKNLSEGKIKVNYFSLPRELCAHFLHIEILKIDKPFWIMQYSWFVISYFYMHIAFTLVMVEDRSIQNLKIPNEA